LFILANQKQELLNLNWPIDEKGGDWKIKCLQITDRQYHQVHMTLWVMWRKTNPHNWT
jgi:hypothetical protein